MVTSRSYRNGSEEFARVAAYYDIPDITIAEKIRLLVTDTYNDWNASDERRNYDEIIPGLYLGRIPCNDGFQIPDNVKLVVSVVAYQEIAGKGLLKSVTTPAEWEERGVQHIHVLMPDFTSNVSAEDMLNAIKQIKAHLDANKDDAVYVHCKAGRSRSAMLCAIYLAIYGGMKDVPHTDDLEVNFQHALEYIKTIRPHVDVLKHQVSKARDVFSLFLSPGVRRQEKQHAATLSDGDAIHDYLASLEAKDAIRQLTSFKSLAEYATEIQYFFSTCHRTNHIRDFFQDIILSNDGSWYDRLINHEGPIKKLLDADKGLSLSGQEDKKRREKLVSDFVTELQNHLIDKRLLAYDSFQYR